MELTTYSHTAFDQPAASNRLFRMMKEVLFTEGLTYSVVAGFLSKKDLRSMTCSCCAGCLYMPCRLLVLCTGDSDAVRIIARYRTRLTVLNFMCNDLERVLDNPVVRETCRNLLGFRSMTEMRAPPSSLLRAFNDGVFQGLTTLKLNLGFRYGKNTKEMM